MMRFVWSDLKVTKRSKLVAMSVVLTVGMAASLLFDWPLWTGLILAVMAGIGLSFSLEWDLKREEWLVIPLPLMMAVMAAFGWLGLYIDNSWLIGLGCVAFGVGVYGLSLTLNIVNLSTAKPLPLVRTATSVLSMTNLMIGFVWYYLLLYYQPAYAVWVGGVVVVTLLLGWPMVWLGLAGKKLWWRGLAWSGLAALVLGQVAAIIGLWPRSFMTSLFLSGCLYIVLGVIHYQERRQTNKKMNQQYLMVFGLMLVALYLVTSWYGGI